MATQRRRKRRRGINPAMLIVYGIVAAMFIGIIAVAGVVISKFAPTKERMDLTAFFMFSKPNETAVIYNGQYMEITSSDQNIYAIHDGDTVYLEIGFVKKNIDNGYVFDEHENILRYTTESQVYSANLGSKEYTIDKDYFSLSSDIMLSQDGTVFISTEYLKILSDFVYSYESDPSRISIETPGFTKKVCTVKDDTQLRRFGGNKSAILADVKKDSKVSIVEEYEEWTYVLSEDLVLGCIKNTKISAPQSVVTDSVLPARTYNHISVGENITLLWHQITANTGNGDIDKILAKSSSLDVMSPVWFWLSDNNGNLNNVASNSYVNACHNKGVKVWATFNNIDGPAEVDTTEVLSHTTSRDALINNILAAAITYDLDGINIDFESLKNAAADGWMEFIKELSIKCEKNQIVLAVSNYVPSDFTGVYNLGVQADYIDYNCIMAYDEFNAASETPGPGASLLYVSKGVQDTLAYFEPSQIILGVPLYTRIFMESSSGLTSKAYSMLDTQSIISKNGASQNWDAQLGMNYVEYTKSDGTVVKFWVEDTASIEEKLKLMQNYNLAGGAIWKNAFDTDSFWNTWEKYL